MCLSISLGNAHVAKVGNLMAVLNVLLAVLWFVSGVATVAFILMHSGRGTGVSDMLGMSLTGSTASLGVVEKNLDRMTVISLCVFVLCIFVMMFTWPQAPIITSMAAAS